MQNIPAGLIPYNHEKYLTGKFIAECRDKFRPKQVVNMEGARQPIIYIDYEGCIAACDNDGVWSDNKESRFDLFLRPKTVNKWHPVFEGWSRETEEECIQSWGMSNRFLKAVEVEVNED